MSREVVEKSILERAEELLSKEEVNRVINRHSMFQLKYFVVLKEPTPHAMMWRCIQELNTRKKSLDALKMEIEDTKDRVELLDIDIERKTKILEEPCLPDENPMLREKELMVHIRRLDRKKQATEQHIQELLNKQVDIEEESEFFFNMFKSLEKQYEFKPYDDMKEQEKMWSEKISQQINMRSLLGLPMDVETVITALSLPDEAAAKKQVVSQLEARQQQLLTEKINSIELKED